MGEKNIINKTIDMRQQWLRQMAASSEPLDIRLTNNYAFKKIFSKPEILKGFLMALLKLKEMDIKALEVADPFEEGEGPGEKESILDIKVHLNNNKKINIEMQNQVQDDWCERSLFYNCRMFVESFPKGMDYSNLEPCFHVGIVNFNLINDLDYYHEIGLLDKRTREVYSDKFGFYVIELKKVKNATEEEKREELYRWASLMAARNQEEIAMAVKGNEYLEAAAKEMSLINANEKERYLYLREQMAIMDEKSRLKTATRIGREEGELRKLISMVCKKLVKGKTISQIADDLEETEETIGDICKAAEREAPEYNIDRIYDRLRSDR